MRLRRIIPRYSLRTLAVFLLLVTSGVGLWWRWEPWYLESSFESMHKHTPMVVQFTEDGGHIEVITGETSLRGILWKVKFSLRERVLYSAATGELVQSTDAESIPGVPVDSRGWAHYKALVACFDRWYVSSDGERSLKQDWQDGTTPPLWSLQVCDARNGSLLHRLDERFDDPDQEPICCSFAPDGKRIAVASSGEPVRIYRRRRPEWWWGVFWLWEFWLTAAFGLLLAWSVVRDRRALGKAEQ